jgi:hypothetical protein
MWMQAIILWECRKGLSGSIFECRCRPFGISNGKSQIKNLGFEIRNSERSEDMSALQDTR